MCVRARVCVYGGRHGHCARCGYRKVQAADPAWEQHALPGATLCLPRPACSSPRRPCPACLPTATSPVAGAVILGEPRAAAAAAARRLGLHYLQRYFYLIAFRCGASLCVCWLRVCASLPLSACVPDRWAACLPDSLPRSRRCWRRVYLDSQPRSLLAASFSEWVRERRELKFLLSQLDLV